MALTRLNYAPGQYETCTNEVLIPSSPVLNTWYHFEIGDWKHLLSDIVLKQGGSAIPAAAFELAEDTKYTAREVTESGKTIYAKWRIVDTDYDAIATTVSGNNFGSYIDNEKLDSRLDALEAFDAALDAGEVPYDNSSSGLTATDVQAAIDEIQGDASKIVYDNSTSGLAADNIKEAVDELAAAVLPWTKGSEVSGLSYTGSDATKVSYFTIADPSTAIATAQFAVVKFTAQMTAGGSGVLYLCEASPSGEAGGTHFAKLFNITTSAVSTVLLLPVGRYAVYSTTSGAPNRTITVVYKILDTKISYT